MSQLIPKACEYKGTLTEMMMQEEEWSFHHKDIKARSSDWSNGPGLPL